MKFDKSKILTVVTADQAKVGSMGYFSNYIPALKKYVTGGYSKPDKLIRVSLDTIYPFFDGRYNHYSLFYPVPEPTYAERQAEWIKENGLKVGDEVWITRPWKAGEDGADCEDCYRSSGMVEAVVNVKEIREKYILIEGGVFSTHHWACPYTALGIIKEPTYRPYNNDELNDIVGEILTNKQSGRRKLVTGKPTASQGVNLDGSYITAKDLLASFYRNTDKPCGVREEA